MNLQFLVARRRAELTQQQLADQLSIAQTDISRIEKAGWIPPAELRARFAKALATPEHELFEDLLVGASAAGKSRQRGAHRS